MVGKGFLQNLDMDFNKVYAPVSRLEIVSLVVALASYVGQNMCQIDVKSSFQNGPLEEEVYVKYLSGFKVKEQDSIVYMLRKALYGLKKSPKEWKKGIDIFLVKLGLNKCTS